MQEREGVSQSTPLNVQGMNQSEQSAGTTTKASFTINKKNGNNEFFDRD